MSIHAKPPRPQSQFPEDPLPAGIDIADVYQYGKFAANLESLVRTGRDGDINLLQVDHDAGDASDAPMKDFMLFMSQVDALKCELDWGAGLSVASVGVGDLCLAPPGVATRVELHGRSRGIIITLPTHRVRDLLESALGRSVADFAGLHVGAFQDPALQRLVWPMWRDMARYADSHNRLRADGELATLVARLAELAFPKAPRSRGPRGLSPRQRNRILDYLDAHTADALSLREMARLVGYSEFHFIRAFKATLGLTPHQYLLRLRLRKAGALIVAGRDPLADIAYQLGFSSQAHLTAAFSSILGISPGALRRGVSPASLRDDPAR